MRFTFSKNTLIILLPLVILLCFSCGSGAKDKNVIASEELVIHDEVNVDEFQAGMESSKKKNDTVKRFGRPVTGLSKTHIFTGANQWTEYMDLLKGKKIGIVANQTSVVNDTLEYEDEVRVVDFHLVDFVVEFQKDVRKVFAPEHGFRGTADAGEAVRDGIDSKTRVPIISLYGKNKKPTPQQLEGIDIMVFDIQDVGARFYTYISTLHYVMEACAEVGIPLIVLDRPNPNGHYIDGPILEMEHQSFVGMHPVPVVHGMTIGEYAQMINGEKWLAKGVQCDLTVISMKNYTHAMPYSLTVKPSPNLPNDKAINLYPSLCFFEGTIVSAGRGTETQFQVFGAPSLPSEFFPFHFTPESNEGAKYPKFKGQVCNGLDLRNSKKLERLNLEWLVEAYVGYGKKSSFFNDFFTKLAGTKKLQAQIEKGYTYPEIRKTWLRDLDAYDKMRQKYMLYK